MIGAYKNIAKAALLGLTALTLWACAQTPDIPPPCPQAVRVHDAAYVARFDGSGRDLTNMLFEAELIGVGLQCEFDFEEGDEEAGIELEVFVTIQAARGLAGRVGEAKVNYFVALTDPDKNVLVREVFDMAVPFEGGQTRAAVEDILDSQLVVPSNVDPTEYKVYVGLELTPEEVKLNRSRR